MMAGDFTLPDIDWENMQVRPSPKYGTQVNQIAVDMADELSLRQMSQLEAGTPLI